MNSNLQEKKKLQRKFSVRKRLALHSKNISASEILIKNLHHFKSFKKSKIIASFFSIKTEISTKCINEFILSTNKVLCFPVIDKLSDKLIFKEYDFNTKLIKGKFGVMEPIESKNTVIPEIILTPCLAFDLKGYRLGYGGGYYDKTFSGFKKNKHKFISIAVAYDKQKVKEVYHNKLDQKIHYILTEKKLYKIQ